MTTDIYKNNPLHSLKLEAMLTELVDHYGWEILAAALNLNCFKTNPNMKGCVKFLRKTTWAREKVEGFYLYRFKNLPRPDDKQFALPPRDRIIPEDQQPRQPVELTLESLERARAQKEANRPQKPAKSSGGPRTRSNNSDNPWQKSSPSNKSSEDTFDPWAAARKKLERGE